ncbi:hypothetical protein BKA62DRAFT_748745 [Auriculariales sp. MPI-PUGE-AT-0066]|nr:hypothetical protein BKA62DRAFT_748745 [Auriculariales sp. MPI-PUGE-AT-0066]
MVADTYVGEDKVVFAFDIGTTQTAVAFVHLQDGGFPHVRSVTKWPGQEEASGDSKLPTLVAYNNAQTVAYGAEALESAATEGLAKWFKLHLHPASMRTNSGASFEIPPLPRGVTLKQVYSHFMRYIYGHSTTFFKGHCIDGPTIWDRLKDRVEIVLAIPNGWDLVQQSFLREAIVLAGVLPAGHDSKRLRFVSEAEASVHFGLAHTGGEQWLKPGMKFCVIDAGGSTVDTTLYKCAAVTPKLELEEVTASDCVQAGSVFVDRNAENMLRIKLKSSRFSDDDYIKSIIEVFERKTKRKFDGSSDASVIAFGRASDNDPEVNISKGRITMTSGEVAMAFQTPIYDIAESFQHVLERANGDCQSLLLVGGFADSPFLRQVLREKNEQRGMATISVDDGTKKAAAEGAVLWYIRQTVVARVCRSHFGTRTNRDFVPTDSRHKERASEAYKGANGDMRIGPCFSPWCAKNEVVRNAEPRTFSYTKRWAADTDIDARLRKALDFPVIAVDLDEAPYWTSESKAKTNRLLPGVRHVCSIKADLSGLRGSLKKKRSDTGEEYYSLHYKCPFTSVRLPSALS